MYLLHFFIENLLHDKRFQFIIETKKISSWGLNIRYIFQPINEKFTSGCVIYDSQMIQSNFDKLSLKSWKLQHQFYHLVILNVL